MATATPAGLPHGTPFRARRQRLPSDAARRERHLADLAAKAGLDATVPLVGDGGGGDGGGGGGGVGGSNPPAAASVRPTARGVAAAGRPRASRPRSAPVAAAPPPDVPRRTARSLTLTVNALRSALGEWTDARVTAGGSGGDLGARVKGPLVDLTAALLRDPVATQPARSLLGRWGVGGTVAAVAAALHVAHVEAAAGRDADAPDAMAVTAAADRRWARVLFQAAKVLVQLTMPVPFPLISDEGVGPDSWASADGEEVSGGGPPPVDTRSLDVDTLALREALVSPPIPGSPVTALDALAALLHSQVAAKTASVAAGEPPSAAAAVDAKMELSLTLLRNVLCPLRGGHEPAVARRAAVTAAAVAAAAGRADVWGVLGVLFGDEDAAASQAPPVLWLGAEVYAAAVGVGGGDRLAAALAAGRARKAAAAAAATATVAAAAARCRGPASAAGGCSSLLPWSSSAHAGEWRSPTAARTAVSVAGSRRAGGGDGGGGGLARRRVGGGAGGGSRGLRSAVAAERARLGVLDAATSASVAWQSRHSGQIAVVSVAPAAAAAVTAVAVAGTPAVEGGGDSRPSHAGRAVAIGTSSLPPPPAAPALTTRVATAREAAAATPTSHTAPPVLLSLATAVATRGGRAPLGAVAAAAAATAAAGNPAPSPAATAAAARAATALGRTSYEGLLVTLRSALVAEAAARALPDTDGRLVTGRRAFLALAAALPALVRGRGGVPLVQWGDGGASAWSQGGAVAADGPTVLDAAVPPGWGVPGPPPRGWAPVAVALEAESVRFALDCLSAAAEHGGMGVSGIGGGGIGSGVGTSAVGGGGLAATVDVRLAVSAAAEALSLLRALAAEGGPSSVPSPAAVVVATADTDVEVDPATVAAAADAAETRSLAAAVEADVYAFESAASAGADPGCGGEVLGGGVLLAAAAVGACTDAALRAAAAPRCLADGGAVLGMSDDEGGEGGRMGRGGIDGDEEQGGRTAGVADADMDGFLVLGANASDGEGSDGGAAASNGAASADGADSDGSGVRMRRRRKRPRLIARDLDANAGADADADDGNGSGSDGGTRPRFSPVDAPVDADRARRNADRARRDAEDEEMFAAVDASVAAAAATKAAATAANDADAPVDEEVLAELARVEAACGLGGAPDEGSDRHDGSAVRGADEKGGDRSGVDDKDGGSGDGGGSDADVKAGGVSRANDKGTATDGGIPPAAFYRSADEATAGGSGRGRPASAHSSPPPPSWVLGRLLDARVIRALTAAVAPAVAAAAAASGVAPPPTPPPAGVSPAVAVAAAQLLRGLWRAAARGRRRALFFHVEVVTFFGGVLALAAAGGGADAASAIAGKPQPRIPSSMPTSPAAHSDGEVRWGCPAVPAGAAPPTAPSPRDVSVLGVLTATGREVVAAFLTALPLAPVLAADSLAPLTQAAASAYAAVLPPGAGGAAAPAGAGRAARRRRRRRHRRAAAAGVASEGDDSAEESDLDAFFAAAVDGEATRAAPQPKRLRRRSGVGGGGGDGGRLCKPRRLGVGAKRRRRRPGGAPPSGSGSDGGRPRTAATSSSEFSEGALAALLEVNRATGSGGEAETLSGRNGG
ncbi:hypothetical protein MMPV_001598 [Pyropia vietnamensis]